MLKFKKKIRRQKVKLSSQSHITADSWPASLAVESRLGTMIDFESSRDRSIVVNAEFWHIYGRTFLSRNVADRQEKIDEGMSRGD